MVPPEKKLFLIDADEMPTPEREPIEPAPPGPPAAATLLLFERIDLSINF